MLFLINVKDRGTIDNYNSATIDYKENSASILTFTILKNSSFFNDLNKYIDKIEVINFNNEIIFTGRVLDIQKSMNEQGEFINTVTCESVLNYLVDVTVPVWNLYGGTVPKKAPVGAEGNITVKDLLNKVLNEYNSGAIFPIKLGNVTVDGNVTLKTNRQTCLEVIMNSLVEVFGGIVQIRNENGVYYLDYLEAPPISEEIIAFDIGVNIQSITIQDKLNNLCTRLIAVGKTQSMQAIAINEDLRKIYGVIDKVVQFDNVTNIDELQEKADLEIKSINNYVLNANIGALDLSYINNDFNSLELYKSVQVTCEELGYNKLHYVVSITLNLLQPFLSTFSLNTNKVTQIDQITQLIQQNNVTNREMTEIHGTLEEKTSNVEFTAYQEQIEKELSNTVANENILELEEAIQRELNGKVSNTEFIEYKEEIATDLSNKTSNLKFGLYQEEVNKELDAKVSITDARGYKENIASQIEGKVSNSEFGLYQEKIQGELNERVTSVELEEVREEALSNGKNKSIVCGGVITNLKSGDTETITLPDIFKSLNGQYQVVYSIASIKADTGAGISNANIIEESLDKLKGTFTVQAEIVSAELGEVKNAGSIDIMWLAIG
ncbi:phage tail protein [uncultured Clostridium sp.]|uniref:phage tail protein n=1 Tax=uncultured Clostridium sp. TaxID=59620 RepID=UPI0026287A21|nr:phage tail protein [uncultured Clostridium sp.]